MNLEFLIAKRVGTATKKSFSRAILRLAVVAIALSMVVMILATAIVSGFKNTISEKIFGFWGHIHITSSYSPSSYSFESSPINQNQDFYPSVDTIRKVLHKVPETDIINSIGLNSYNPNLYIGLSLMLLALLFSFAPQFLKKRIRLSYRLFVAFLLTLASIALLVTQEYQIVQKDVIHETEGGIRHIQLYIHKEGIIKTKDQIEGIVLRGVGADYDWDFLKQYIKEGDILDTQSEDASNGILISETTANRLKLNLGDKFLIYFVQEGNSLGRKFTVVGIYKTGLEEYDRRFALVDVRKLQQLNNWRPFRSYPVELNLDEEQFILKGLTAGTAPTDLGWKYVQEHWNKGNQLNFEDPNFMGAVIPHEVARLKGIDVGDSLKLKYTDTGGDTHMFNYTVSGIYQGPEDARVQKTVFVNWQSINNLNQVLPAQVSGFEIFVDNIKDLDALGDYTNYVVLMGADQYANTIKEIQPNIFDWLSLTDMNERIILLLMILVSIINMTTSLMILILERTNMIGILKALGTPNWSIRKVFLYNAAYIIGYGLFWGNLIGIGLCLLQMQFGIMTLPEDLYYVSVVPIEFNWLTILALNIGTMLITLAVLIIPSWLVSKIDPVKAIRFS
ncbi:FtsX-like permease family protein [Aureispira sp. CCB-E]|uniref:ABC transporter permease n=1 Tax=Aureispira sp. CCB-E TaxID=3051121 RepID=UPI002868406B|nr:FtsX-like permease family protein [Aureispira sp. CCB-E]WMX13339.1 ABC transporter permease [Aureispira sp. CCB-E]